MKFNDVSQQISFVFLGLNSSLIFGDLDSLVCRKRESRGSRDEGSDVPLLLLTLWNVRKAGENILGEFENLNDVRFIEFECAIESDTVVFI